MTPAALPVLLCHDGSEHARHAIAEAGRVIGGGPAIVLTAWEALDSVVVPVPGLAGAVLGGTEKLNEESASVAATLAEQGAAAAREAGFDAEPLPIRANGRVWWAILEAADENDVRAIVLGSRGHSHVGAVLGSVAYHVVHNATRPVLVVPPAQRPPAA